MIESVFKTRKLDDIYDEICNVYLDDDRPWILGFSGGKDSTCMIQLIWNALVKLPSTKLTKKLFIISSDTLVESPKIVETVTDSLEMMENAAKKVGLPVHTNLVRPIIEETFWVCLLGKGYPAPSNTFRWCTDRLKISSANRFIQDQVSEYGEVIMALGSRKDESSTRAQVLNTHHIKGTKLSRHSTLPSAFIYPPLRDFNTEDVWNYLLQNRNPWGANNRDLLSMYQNANASECPLVVDTNTASCGNSRFGCWVCTVVSEDKSMTNMIDNGETWMEPLLELRQDLKDTQDPEIKKKVRDVKHRNGKIIFWKDRLAMGPYTMEFCQNYLKKLLTAQNEVRKNGPDPKINLITLDEIHEIQKIWRIERGDWKNSAYTIYEEITNEKIDTPLEDLGILGVTEQEELEKICHEFNIPPLLAAKILHVEFEMQEVSNRQKVHHKIEKILNEEWRNDMDIAITDVKNKKRRIAQADM